MKRFTKTLLAIGLFVIAAQSFTAAANLSNTTPIDPTERAKIEEVIRQYLLAKPEILIQAMQVLQRKQYAETQQTVKQTQQIAATFANALFHQPNDPVSGNPNGKTTIVEFFDYQCPHCIDVAPVVDAVVKANPDLRVVYKEFPIRGPVSEFAARAALAANLQGKYYDLSHALLKAPQPLTQDAILNIAKATPGIDIEKLKKEMDGQNIKDQLKGTLKLAEDLKLFGTPAFFISKTNDQGKENINYVPGQIDQKQLQNLITQANK
jgi:protein-disulfide isomerase